MFDQMQDDDVFSMSDAFEALSELENNTSRAILVQRSSERIEIQAKVLIQPGNASQRHQATIEGITADVSNGGCMILLPRPILVGDMFWLTFDKASFRIGSLMSRCLRCRMVREDAYESGFRFMNEIDLSNSLAVKSPAEKHS